MCALYNTGYGVGLPIIFSLVMDNGVVLVSYTLYAIMSLTGRIVRSSRSSILRGNDDKRRRRFPFQQKVGYIQTIRGGRGRVDAP